MSRHVVLAGDSLFDNAAYIGGGPDVATQLRGLLGSEDQVTLLAIDGSVCSDVVQQLENCPSDATHLVVSAGGNDILHHAAILQETVGNVAATLDVLAAAGADFAPIHARMVDVARKLDLPTAICTIYDANMGKQVATALSIFNDAISRNAFSSCLDLIDLRLVCNDPGDYANPIEPSVQGGAKIARAIAGYVDKISNRSPNSRVFI